MGSFLMVYKEYFDDKELKPEDMLILAQINEFNRNGCDCFMTNKQFSEMCHVSEKSIERAINRLEKLGYIIRKTKTVKGFGNIGRQRTLSIKISDNKDTVNESVPSQEDTANLSGRYRQNQPTGYRQNGAIKDNRKENKKKTSTPNGVPEGYEFITSNIGIKCTEQEYIDACSKYENVDYDNVVYFRNLYRDGMNIFEYVDAIKDSIG